MQSALLLSAFVMGLAGGPHCVAMCGAACAGVVRIVQMPVAGNGAAMQALSRPAAPWLLHASRIAGYAFAGALAAAAVGGLASGSASVVALRPLWTLLHVTVLAWGLVLAVAGRQPRWAHRAGHAVALRLYPLTRSSFGLMAIGALWVTMPCGLLYSALMLASLANGPAQGALAMALFAVGSALSLVLAPVFWRQLRWRIGAVSPVWGCRLAGAVLVAVALQAIWIDMAHQIERWCR